MRILKEFESKPKRRIGLDSFWSSLWHHPIKTVSYYWTVFLWLYHDDDRYLRMSGKKREEIKSGINQKKVKKRNKRMKDGWFKKAKKRILRKGG